MIKKLNLVLLTATLLIFNSCAYDFTIKTRLFIQNPVNHYEAQVIVDSTFVAVQSLLSCSFLKDNYPANYQKLVNLQKKGIYFSVYEKDEGYLCAQAMLNSDEIFIFPATFYNKDCGSPENTIAHEILHLIGFGHEKYDVGYTPDFYYILNQCI